MSFGVAMRQIQRQSPPEQDQPETNKADSKPEPPIGPEPSVRIRTNISNADTDKNSADHDKDGREADPKQRRVVDRFVAHRSKRYVTSTPSGLCFEPMTSRSGRGRWQRVIEARQQARATLGRDPNQTDLFEAPPRATTPLRAPEPVTAVIDPYARPQRVLSLGEAAARLGVGRSELEAMIEAGKIEALPTGFTRMIPTRVG